MRGTGNVAQWHSGSVLLRMLEALGSIYSNAKKKKRKKERERQKQTQREGKEITSENYHRKGSKVYNLLTFI
jgi:hypothetical protein